MRAGPYTMLKYVTHLCSQHGILGHVVGQLYIYWTKTKLLSYQAQATFLVIDLVKQISLNSLDVLDFMVLYFFNDWIIGQGVKFKHKNRI